MLASVQEPDKVVLIAGVTADQTAKVKAGDLVNVVAQKIGGRGGGRADMAQAGGNDPSKLDEALAAVRALDRGRSSRRSTKPNCQRVYVCEFRRVAVALRHSLAQCDVLLHAAISWSCIQRR